MRKRRAGETPALVLVHVTREILHDTFRPAVRGPVEQDELFGISDGQHLEQHHVNQAENRCVRPDAEREREHGNGGEAGVLQQLAEGEAEVVHGWLSVVRSLLSVVLRLRVPRSALHICSIQHSAFSLLHSLRSATFGSTRAARRAGSQQAKSATAPRTNGMTAKVSGSVGLTSKSRLDR